MEQLYVNDELSYLKKERELFRQYEGKSTTRPATNILPLFIQT